MPKRYKVKVNFKRKKRALKNWFFGFLVLAGVSSLGFLYPAAKKNFNSWKSAVYSREIRFASADFGSAPEEKEFSEYLKTMVGSQFDGKKKKDLVSYIQNKWPYLSGVKAEFSRITGSLKVSAEPEKTVAVMDDGGEKRFLLESGRLITAGSCPPDLPVIRSEKALSSLTSEFAAFVSEFYSKKKEMLFEATGIVFQDGGKDFYVQLSDGSRIIWGGLSYTGEKIRKINGVLKDACEKISPPLKVDARYFEEGKIFVSPLK